MSASTLASIEASIPALRRYARALLRDRQETDDLVHDCLLRALAQLHTRRDDGDMRAWLFAIMHNLFVSRLRRARVRGTPAVIDEVGEESVAVLPRQEAHIEADDLMRAVDRLPEEQRSVLLLVSVEDLSYAEVARVLDIPLGTVMSRLARARERLARATERREPAARRSAR